MAEAPMEFVNRGHLGGYIKADQNWPHGDPRTYVPKVWDYLYNRYLGDIPVPKVLDVGCGEGHAVEYFASKHCAAVGLDGAEEAIAAFNSRHSPGRKGNVFRHDFTQGPFEGIDVSLVGEVDLIWSCEFVEHVEEKYAGNFLRTFDKARIVAMTHAEPGQPGHHHVNCQPEDYWRLKLLERGFVVDEEATMQSRAIYQDTHWTRSGLVFVRATKIT